MADSTKLPDFINKARKHDPQAYSWVDPSEDSFKDLLKNTYYAKGKTIQRF